MSQDIQAGGGAGTTVPASSGGQGAAGVDNEILETAGKGTSETSAGSVPETAGRAAAGVDATEPAAGTGATDSGDTTTTVDVEIPEPVTTPYVWGVGIGITDIPVAVKFYTEVMAVTVEASDVVRDDRTETVLYASEADRGSRLVLMNFNDGRNTQKITAKLVWQAADPSGLSLAAAAYPDYVSRLNMGIVQFDGPETYIHEVGNIFDTGGVGITVPYLIAIGFSVSDLPASRAFYTTAFGMTEAVTGTFPVVQSLARYRRGDRGIASRSRDGKGTSHVGWFSRAVSRFFGWLSLGDLYIEDIMRNLPYQAQRPFSSDSAPLRESGGSICTSTRLPKPDPRCERRNSRV